MSFSQPTKVENPALHFYEWRNGQLSHYDKEKKENIPVKLPFEFIVLDELTTITGYHKLSDSGIFSNEIKQLGRQELHVRAFKGGDIARGLYASIKDTVKAAGGKYTRSIYIAEKVNGQYVISHIKFSGAAFGAWLEFTRSHNPETGKFLLTGSVEGKNGATVYQMPVFKYGTLTDADIQAATELDTDLQKYLARYMETNELEQDDSVHAEDFDDSETMATPEQLAEFEKLKAEKRKPQNNDDVFEDIQATYNSMASEEPPFTDDDIPAEFQ